MTKNTRSVRFHAAGVTFNRRQDFLCGLQAARKARLSLVREPRNAHDANAIKILANTGHRFMIGYVPREVARTLAPIMDGGTFVRIADWGVVGGRGLSRGVSIEVHYDVKGATA